MQSSVQLNAIVSVSQNNKGLFCYLYSCWVHGLVMFMYQVCVVHDSHHQISIHERKGVMSSYPKQEEEQDKQMGILIFFSSVYSFFNSFICSLLMNNVTPVLLSVSIRESNSDSSLE